MSTRTIGSRPRKPEAKRNVAAPLPADVASEFIDSAREAGTTGAEILRAAALSWLEEHRRTSDRARGQEGLPID